MAQKKQILVFMFLERDADPTPRRTTLSLKPREFIAVSVRNYDHAAEVSRELVKEGAIAIELCAGFGNIGVARVAEAVKGIPVGMVRFDMHPVLQGKTGDQLFGLTP
jgi:hypothetical protein